MNIADRSSLTLRLPQNIKDWLGKEAKANGNSQNSEIIRAIRQRMEAATGERFANRTPAAAD